MVLFNTYTRSVANEEESKLVTFQSTTNEIYKYTDIMEWFEENVKGPILTEMEEFSEHGSGKFC